MTDDSSEISKKEKILLAASKLFLEKDFKTVSTQEIASKAGVAKGTVFHHYENKHLLALAVLDVFVNQMVSDFDKMKETTEPKEIIIGMIHYSMDLVTNSTGLTQLLFQVIGDIDHLTKEPENEVEKQIQNEVRKVENLLVGFINEFAIIFKRMGFENPIAYSRIFIGVLDGLGLQFALNPKPDTKLMEELTTTMIALFTKR
ncbi:MAG: HTH-type transcriptional repressor KstR2 [Candidatus Heimdallarchaeota archaeon LC_2]|nr:MAG: HTH-type transcriptional repressor KstR2 [Candidatus Heimdallarchaeota archaeon LC_2]